MRLDRLRKQWETFGRRDPLWAVLTHPEKQGGGWDEQAFFALGKEEIEKTLEEAASLGLTAGKDRALDFGCGVGRLTQALCGHFREVVGVDISSSMIERAQHYNRHGPRCLYRLNTQDHLRQFPSGMFDFICSNITLQHMELRYIQGYLQEFLRILRPGGTLVFQLPERIRSIRSRLREVLPPLLVWLLQCVWHAGRPVMEMYGMDRKEVTRILESSGGRVMRVRPDPDAGEGIPGLRWFVLKP